MPVVIAASLVGLAVVLVALWRDEPIAPRGASARGPDWRGLPEPSDLVRVGFPLSFPGYDPATVDLTLDALVRAYEDLWVVAPEDVRDRARRRAAARDGIEVRSFDPDALPEPPAVAVPLPPELGEHHAEALAAEAALSSMEERRRATDDTGEIA
jgi:hypothetical protein